MSVPSHCKLMKPASVEFKSFIDGFEFKTRDTVVNNVNASIEQDEEKIKDNQLNSHNSVRWNEIMLVWKIKKKRFIECGPSKVLMDL